MKYQWINGQEHLLRVLRFYSSPPGLKPRISNISVPMWINTKAYTLTNGRPTR